MLISFSSNGKLASCRPILLLSQAIQNITLFISSFSQRQRGEGGHQSYEEVIFEKRPGREHR
jgi:hypothetical protein